jgi:hypothetical protein
LLERRLPQHRSPPGTTTVNAAADYRHLLDRMVRRYPPRRYRADQYQRWFPKTAAVMRRYLERFALPQVGGDRPLRTAEGAVGIVVTPWFSTAVPWYSLMLGIGLARRGRKVILLWDDTRFPQRSVDEQNRAIADVLSVVRGAIPVLRLTDAVGAEPKATDQALIDSLTKQNLMWTLRGALPTDGDRPLIETMRCALTRSLPLVRSGFDGADLACVVVPGGVSGTSGLFLEAARERGCRGATFDVDRGIAQICTSGVAAQGGDLARAFDTLWNSDDKTRSGATAAARVEFTRRTEGRDRYGFQHVPSGASADLDEIAAVIPMNVEWDTAALGRHVHFADTVDWLNATISEILEADVGSVIVRQHPSERNPSQRSRLNVGGILRDRFGEDRRVRFVAADDSTNTYDLLRSAPLVLPFVSTIGIEAAALNKPVLVSGASYYADLGFVWSAGSRDEYFALLRQGLRRDLPLLPDQSDRAWICYYLAAVSNRVWTDFTPSMDDFWKWCRRAPDSLFSEPEVADILEALDCDVPVSLLRHHRVCGATEA